MRYTHHEDLRQVLQECCWWLGLGDLETAFPSFRDAIAFLKTTNQKAEIDLHDWTPLLEIEQRRNDYV